MLSAKELLQRAELALGTLSKGNSLNYRLAAGFLYKTYEQFYFAQGDQATGNDYLDKALALFKSVSSETVTQKDAVIPFAEAIHGMGNVYQGRGQFRDAIRQYEMVVAILPTYAYSWHDMFLCYASLAEQGEVDVAAMRRALKMLEETAKGWLHIDDARIAWLKATLAKYDGSKSPAPN
jgi:tetratricopeptide (TPR) repeat protein